MKKDACQHRDLNLRFDVPLDIKSGRETRFGSVCRCAECGLSLVHPQPDPDQIPAHYDLPAYYTHGESHIPAVTATLADRLVAHLAWRTDRGSHFDPMTDIAGPLRGGRALDIGCGAGTLLSAIRQAGLETFGVDPDEKARQEAGKNGHQVYLGTAEALPAEIEGARFEVVTMTHVLEHCLNPVLALTNARRLLSDAGLFYCEVPNAGSVYFETYGQISEMLDVPRHLYFFRKADLETMAAQAGLEITGWKYRGLTRHFTADWKSWENDIYDRLAGAGATPSCGRRSVMGDLKLLASGLVQAPQRRYDCIGFMARRAAA